MKTNELTSEELLYDRYIRMVVSQVIRFASTRVTDVDDYKQASFLGLLKALRKKNYDPKKGSFSTYAWKIIHNSILTEYKKFESHDVSLHDNDEKLIYNTGVVEEYLPELTDTENLVITMIACNYSMRDIALEMECSKEWVRLIYKKAIKKVQEANVNEA